MLITGFAHSHVVFSHQVSIMSRSRRHIASLPGVREVGRPYVCYEMWASGLHLSRGFRSAFFDIRPYVG